MLNKPVIDWERGGVYDAFERHKDKTMWNSNKAWWQQEQAVCALILALKRGVLKDPAVVQKARRAVEGGIAFFFDNFVDHVHGSEFDVVQEGGKPPPEATKGNPGKSAYHTVEFMRYLERYRCVWAWPELAQR
jgi:hypothetical protein